MNMKYLRKTERFSQRYIKCSIVLDTSAHVTDRKRISLLLLIERLRFIFGISLSHCFSNKRNTFHFRICTRLNVGCVPKFSRTEYYRCLGQVPSISPIQSIHPIHMSTSL